MKTCSMCGRRVKTTVTCLYQRHGLETCPDCCEKCHRIEPFPCREYDRRARPRKASYTETAAKKWAEILGLPEEQAIPCLIAYACKRYHIKTGTFRVFEALFRLKVALRNDTFAEAERITAFAESWKAAAGDSLAGYAQIAEYGTKARKNK